MTGHGRAGRGRSRALLTGFMCVLAMVLSRPGTTWAQAIEDVVSIETSASDGALGLTGLVAYALRNNPGVAAAEREAEARRLDVSLADAARLPRLDLEAGLSWHTPRVPVTPVYEIFASGPAGADFEHLVPSAGLLFSLPLYTGGRLERQAEIARLAREAAGRSWAAGRRDLAFNVASAYYKVLQLDRVLAASAATVTQLEAHRVRVQQLLTVGRAARLDLMETDVRLARARETSLRVRNGLARTAEGLRTLLGMEGSLRRLRLAVPDDVAPAPAPDYDACLAIALAQRPEVLAAAARREAARLGIDVARSARRPAVSLAAGVEARSAGSFPLADEWNVGLLLSLPVFDGGTATLSVARAVEESRKAEEEERAVRLQVGLEVKEAMLSLENAAARESVTEEAIAVAREALRVQVLKYETRAGTNTDVLDAQTALLAAETDYRQARFDREIARAALRRAMGEEALP